jgi:antitoxin (DNA-binding transcriptional repressor) of toxin-antitoxin stability system
LSALLERVRRGETVVIEDRGVPIAQIAPLDRRDTGADRDHLLRLERRGILRPARARAGRPDRLLASPPPRPVRQVALSALVLRERAESW